MKCIVFDCETVPDQVILSDEAFIETFREKHCGAPANYKDPVKILAYETEAFKKAKAGLALQAWSAQVVAIAWQDLDSDVGPESSASLTDEKFVLQTFIDALPKDSATLAGFYIRRFDVPLVTERCGVHRLQLPQWWPTDHKYRGLADLHDILPEGSLDCHLRAHRLPVKTAKGSEVSSMSVDDVREYCREDVRRERWLVQIYRERFEALRRYSVEIPILDPFKPAPETYTGDQQKPTPDVLF